MPSHMSSKGRGRPDKARRLVPSKNGDGQEHAQRWRVRDSLGEKSSWLGTTHPVRACFTGQAAHMDEVQGLSGECFLEKVSFRLH